MSGGDGGEGAAQAVEGEDRDFDQDGIFDELGWPAFDQVMAELGIDLGGHTSKLYDDVASRAWDYLITVCDDANERCPWVPGSVQRLHWSFPDPSRAVGQWLGTHWWQRPC